MKRRHAFSGLAVLVWVCGCTSGPEINPYLTLMESLGIATGGETGPGTSPGQDVTAPFRRDLTITFRNNHPDAELNVSFVAWVNVSSIRSAEQQDALLANGYVQLRSELRLGTAFTLPVGTFIYNGPGEAGATAVFLEPAQAGGGQQGPTPTTLVLTLITPDAVLAFSQPPVSCESVAFFYSQNGEPLTAVPVGGGTGPYSGSTGEGGFKTLAQVDVYQCDPLRPGLFLVQSGAGRERNEYLEGENIVLDFNAVPDADGDFAIVTIGEP